MAAHDRGHGIVVHTAVADRVGVRYEVEVGQRVGRENLEVDAALAHAAQPQLHVHEWAADIPHAIEPVIRANLEERHTVRILAEKGAEFARCTHRLLEHDVGVQVDHCCGPDHGVFHGM